VSHELSSDRFSDLTPPRALVLSADQSLAPLAGALADRKIEVESASSIAAFSSALASRFWPALVLDLVSFPDEPAVWSAVAGARKGEDGRPPFVAAVTADGQTPSAGASPANLCVSRLRVLDAVDPLALAVASSRLAEAMSEITRLRAAVVYARDTAHDLAQPLTTVLGRAQLLAMTAKAGEKHHKGVTIIAQEADRMATITERFTQLKVMVLRPK